MKSYPTESAIWKTGFNDKDLNTQLRDKFKLADTYRRKCLAPDPDVHLAFREEAFLTPDLQSRPGLGGGEMVRQRPRERVFYPTEKHSKWKHSDTCVLWQQAACTAMHTEHCSLCHTGVSARSGIFKVSLRSPGWLNAVDSLFWALRELVKGTNCQAPEAVLRIMPAIYRVGILRTGTSNV